MSNVTRHQDGVEVTACDNSASSPLKGQVSSSTDAQGSDGISRRDAMSAVAKYGAAAAPVMITLFHGNDALAGGGGHGGSGVSDTERYKKSKWKSKKKSKGRR